MKAHFKIFILFLVICCYANTVFEFSENEKKSNFENESHYYIHQTINNNVGFSATQNIPFGYFILNTYPNKIFLPSTLSLNSSSGYEIFFYPPPDKLYLLHLALLI